MYHHCTFGFPSHSDTLTGRRFPGWGVRALRESPKPKGDPYPPRNRADRIRSLLSVPELCPLNRIFLGPYGLCVPTQTSPSVSPDINLCTVIFLQRHRQIQLFTRWYIFLPQAHCICSHPANKESYHPMVHGGDNLQPRVLQRNKAQR